MDVLAYCAASWADQVRQAAGVDPLTCPPLSAEEVTPEVLQGYGLLYLDLHGAPGWACLEGDDRVPALCAETVRQAELGGVLVYATTCHIDETEILPAALEAGATVIGGSELNFEVMSGPVVGVHLLGLWIRRLSALGLPAEVALGVAKLRVRMAGNSLAVADTLEFRIWRGAHEQ